MKPAFRHDRATIWRASCLDVSIPKEAIVITDPPYNVGKPQLIGKFKDRENGTFQEHIGKDFGEDFDQSAMLPKQWVPAMPDVVLCFYGAKRMFHLLRAFARNGYETVQDFHWCKTNAPPPLRAIGFAWGTESGYVFRRKGTKHTVNKKAGYSPNFFVSSLCREGAKHTTQKPVNVMKWLINTFTTRDSLVCDPFMGSGSVAVACAVMGRRFMGIEQKEDYCQEAIARTQAALVKHANNFMFD